MRRLVVDPAHAPELHRLAALLVYGTAASRRRLAARLVTAHEDGEAEIALLTSTVRSHDPWQLRARSLEVLGLVAGSADRGTAERILLALLGQEAVNDTSSHTDSRRGDGPL